MRDAKIKTQISEIADPIPGSLIKIPEHQAYGHKKWVQELDTVWREEVQAEHRSTPAPSQLWGLGAAKTPLSGRESHQLMCRCIPCPGWIL